MGILFFLKVLLCLIILQAHFGIQRYLIKNNSNDNDNDSDNGDSLTIDFFKVSMTADVYGALILPLLQ